MAHQAPIRILLVEDNDAELQFLREAVEEAASLRAWPGYGSVELFCAGALDEACDLAFDGGFDAVLLNPSLPDSPTIREAFGKMQTVVPSTPVLVLADDDDPVLAAHLLRDGAQEVLPKSGIDAATLATAVRNSIERQRFVNAARFAPERSVAPAVLPSPPDPGAADDVLLSLMRIADVCSEAPEIETAMLAD